jgi:hypothetical protein
MSLLRVIVMMKAALAMILPIYAATWPLFGAVPRAKIWSCIHACNLSQGDHENCRRHTCVRALKQLVQPDSHQASEHLSVSTKADLNDNGHDIFRLHGRPVTMTKDNILAHKWKTNLFALKTYRYIHGNMRIPQRFVVPTDDQRWPKTLHGLNLGYVVDHLRRRRDALAQNHLDALEELGFVWRVSHDEKWRKNLLALKTFKDIYNHVRVPQRFVIPTDDQRWPKTFHGLNLGYLVDHFRKRRDALTPNQLDALDALGFIWRVSHDEIWEKNSWR